MSASTLFKTLFLEKRPSVSLSLFRPFIALAVGAHIIPTFVQMGDNYLSTAFKLKNVFFFSHSALYLVDKSPDWLVIGMSIFFCLTLLSFALGLFTQISCILTAIGCYYFYAMNSMHIGTLSYDILLVSLILMCVTPYPGDSFSLDALRRGDRFAYRKKRPFFIQRLLQIQLAAVYFFTGLQKITMKGNWITDNPMYYIFNGYPDGVVKNFPFRDFFAHSPHLSYVLGIFIVFMELLLPFLLFIRATRYYAICLGIVFHILLITTLHVPSLFFFHFVPMFALFIDPEIIVKFIDKKRRRTS